MQSVSSVFLSEWNSQGSSLNFSVVKVNADTSETALKCDQIRVNRKRDYKLATLLSGEMSLVILNDSTLSLSVNDKLRVYGGFLGEMVPIFTGYIDRTVYNPASQSYEVSLRDGLKKFQRFKIAPAEQINAFIKTLLTSIANEVGVAGADQDFDNPSVTVLYWAPIDQLAYDETTKLVEASVDADFYADELGKIIYRNYISGTLISSLWDTDTDWNTKVSTNTNWTVSGGMLTPSYSAAVEKESGSSGGGGSLTFPAAPARTLVLDYQVSTTLEMTADAAGGKLTSVDFNFGAFYGRDNPKPSTASMTVQIYDNSGNLKSSFNATPFQANGGATYAAIVGTVDLSSQSIIYNKTDKIKITATWRWTGNGLALPDFTPVTVTPLVTGTKIDSATGFTITNKTSQHLTYSVGNTVFNTANLTDSFISGIKIAPLSGAMTYESDNIATGPSAWGTFDVVDSGHAFGYYLRTSPDGVTYSAPITVTKNTNLQGVVALTAYHRWGVTYTPNDFTDFYIDLVRLNWFIGGNADRFQKSVSAVLDEDIHILDVTEEISDELGGSNALINSVTVKAVPLYAEGTAGTVWQGTVSGNPVSGANTLILTANQSLTLDVDLGDNVLESSQVLVANVTVGGVTPTYTAHSSKPTIVLLAGAGGATIDDFRITGKRIIQEGTIQSEASDATSITLYGESKEDISNDYINSSAVAATLATTEIRYYKDPRFILSATLKFSPQFQIGDRVTVQAPNSLGYIKDFIIIEISHGIRVSKDRIEATTQLKLWEIR